MTEVELVEQQRVNNRSLDAHLSSGNDFLAATRVAQNNPTQLWVLKDIGADLDTIQQLSNRRFLNAHQHPGNDFSVVTRKARNNDTRRWLVKPV